MCVCVTVLLLFGCTDSPAVLDGSYTIIDHFNFVLLTSIGISLGSVMV